MAVTQQVPGRLGLSLSGSTTNFPLTAQVPADQTCTGTVAGQDNVCMVRCQNPALAGPFGGVVPVQMPQTSATSAATTGAATNGTAAAAEATSGTASGIAAANTETDNTTPAQKAAELREDAQKKRKIRRASRIERRTAAGIAYRHGVKS
ncbi:hypothetical protein LTR40_007734 [Exophiala xenobiotica]|nr:hypothetical protein LTR40_007734 [Exophiala xenobiotica]